jgi:sugar-specific transcriptional regulator TrmB
MQRGEIFDRLGFPKHSDSVYGVLETSGPHSVSAIGKRIRVHRPAIYRSLLALVKAGLVSEKTFGKRPFYIAESHDRIARLFSGETLKVKAVEKAERNVKNSMGSIRYFEGERGITSIFNDVAEHCKKGETFYRYTSERDLDEVNKYLPTNYRKRRDTKRLERLVISNPESGKKKRNRLERFIKYLGSDKESFHQNAIQIIYGSRIAFIDLNTHKAFIIENKTLAEFQKSIFKALYRRL